MEDTNPKLMNRWLVVVGAILIQLSLGAIYAWSVFTPALTAKDPSDVAIVYSAKQLGISAEALETMRKELAVPKAALAKAPDAEKVNLLSEMETIAATHGAKERIDGLKYGMTKTQTQGVFAAGLALFAIVMVLAGRMMPKLGPRKLVMAGGVLLGAGYVLAGLIQPGQFWPTFLLVGVLGGSGIGLGYVVPIAVGMKWFPDKKGLVAGLAVAGFGFGATLWVKLAGAWGHLIADMGLGNTFIVYGIVFFLLCMIGAIWMKNPPADWVPAGWTPPEPKGDGGARITEDFTSREMLAKPQFYMIFLCFIFGAGAGLMSIGLMKLFPQQALEAGGLSATQASAIAGTAMAVFFSLANGIGRIAWGAMSDKLGRKRSICIMLATQGILVIAFQWMAGSEYMLYLGATLIGFNFGGNFALFPTITADTFGTKHIGQNYGWVFLAYGIGGIGGPMLGGRLGDLGNFPLAFTICGVLCLVAAGVAAMISHPHQAAIEEPQADAE
jgi:MFS transporter, OFA family, oxalate/formate antiporter